MAASEESFLEQEIRELILGPCNETLESVSFRGLPRLTIPPLPPTVHVQRDNLDYEDLLLVGSGKFGMVYQLNPSSVEWDTTHSLPSKVALKRVKNMCELEGELKDRAITKLAKEAALQIASNWYNPTNVPAVLAFLIVLDFDIIVEVGVLMRFVEGASLYDWNGRAQKDEDRLSVLSQIALFLHFENCVRLEHADLHSGNLLVSRTDKGDLRLFVVDFGRSGASNSMTLHAEKSKFDAGGVTPLVASTLGTSQDLDAYDQFFNSITSSMVITPESIKKANDLIKEAKKAPEGLHPHEFFFEQVRCLSERWLLHGYTILENRKFRRPPGDWVALEATPVGTVLPAEPDNLVARLQATVE